MNVPFSHPSGGRAQKDGRKVRWCCEGTFTLSRTPRPASSTRHGAHPVRHAGRALQRHDAGRAPCARPPVEIDIFVRDRRCHRLPRTKMSISTPEGASARSDRHSPARDTTQHATRPSTRRGSADVAGGQVELDRKHGKAAGTPVSALAAPSQARPGSAAEPRDTTHHQPGITHRAAAHRCVQLAPNLHTKPGCTWESGRSAEHE